MYVDYEQYCNKRKKHCNSNESDYTELNNLLFSFIESVNNNTNAIENLITNEQNNSQYQASSDNSALSDIGNNEVNVIGFIDPDTFSNANSTNVSDIDNSSFSISESLAASLAVELKELINQISGVGEA